MKVAWQRLLGGIAIGALILFGVLYSGDWLIWRWRMAHGTGNGTVEVRQFLATSLKGSKTEYDLLGIVQEPCSVSIFPQQGNPACWWLRRHSSQWE
jgi:hypothetical protein